MSLQPLPLIPMTGSPFAACVAKLRNCCYMSKLFIEKIAALIKQASAKLRECLKNSVSKLELFGILPLPFVPVL